jgi:hypothetical protein
MKKIFKNLVILAVIVITSLTLNVKNSQAQGKVWFFNGTSWVDKYKNPTIAGVAGDTVKFGYKDAVGNFQKVIWTAEDPNTAVQTTIDTSTTIKVAIQPLMLGFTYYVYDTTGLIQLCQTTVGAKFIPSAVTLSSSKSLTQTLSLSNFNIKINSPTGGYKAHCDSIYWYCDGILVHAGLDTIYNANISGDYKIKAKLIYITAYSGDTNTFARYQMSNTIKVEIATGITNDYSSKEVFKVYPNPTTDYLYFSKEITFSVFSMNGQEISKGFGSKVDVREFKSGIYILKTESNSFRFVVK